MGKVTCFRPSEKAEQAIVSLVKEKKAKNKSDAVNQLIQKALEPQLEFPPKTDDRKIPETTGILVACELRSIPVPYDEPFVLWKPPVDSSVCKTCPKYPCEEWEWIFSEKRVNELIRKDKASKSEGYFHNEFGRRIEYSPNKPVTSEEPIKPFAEGDWICLKEKPKHSDPKMQEALCNICKAKDFFQWKACQELKKDHP